MKIGKIGSVCLVVAAAMAGSAQAASDGGAYDPMALDQFIATSLAGSAVSQAEPDLDTLLQPRSGTELAQDSQKFDSDGYLIGPDGKRILKPLKPRWRVGVFR